MNFNTNIRFFLSFLLSFFPSFLLSFFPSFFLFLPFSFLLSFFLSFFLRLLFTLRNIALTPTGLKTQMPIVQISGVKSLVSRMSEPQPHKTQGRTQRTFTQPQERNQNISSAGNRTLTTGLEGRRSTDLASAKDGQI